MFHMRGAALSLFIFGGVMLVTAMSCDECGEECRRFCGTKQFRPCCFNYLRKRSGSLTPEEGPDLRLEVSLANSQGRHPGNIPTYLLAPYSSYGGGGGYPPQGQRVVTPPRGVGGPPTSNSIENEQDHLHLIYDA